MNKLNILENLNNVIVREQNIPKSAAMRRDLVLSKLYEKKKRRDLVLSKLYEKKKSYGMVHINFGNIFIPDTSYLNGRIETRYHVGIDKYDISHIRYEGQDKLNLKKLNFLGIGKKEIWEIGGVVRDDGSHIYKFPTNISYFGDTFFRNKYRFSINGWIVPEYSYLSLTKSWGSSKNDTLAFLVDVSSQISFKYCDIFNLERVKK
jgi:hypothetical protein